MSIFEIARRQLGLKYKIDMAKIVGVSKERYNKLKDVKEPHTFHKVKLAEYMVSKGFEDWTHRFKVWKWELDNQIDSDLYEYYGIKKGEKL